MTPTPVVIAYLPLGTALPPVPGGPRFVLRRADLWPGTIERDVNKAPVVAVHAPGRGDIEAAYAAAGIPAWAPENTSSHKKK